MTPEYYQANKAKIVRRVQEWAKENPEKVKGYRAKKMLKNRNNRPYMRQIYDAKSRALRGGIEFNLTEQWARDRWTGKCELTGAPFDIFPPNNKPSMYSISLDRVDSSKGYMQDNCRFILWAINRFKSNYDDETMLTIARMLVGVN